MKKTHDYTYIFKVEKMNKEGRRFESDQHRRSSHYVDFSNVIEIILVSMKNKKIHSNFRESDKYILNTKPGGFLPPNNHVSK